MATRNMLLLLLLLAIMLFESRGHYHPTLIFGLPLLWLCFWMKPHKYNHQSESKKEILLWTLLVGTFCGASAYRPVLIYVRDLNAWHTIRILYLLATAYILYLGVKMIKDSWRPPPYVLFIFTIIVGAALFFVMAASPQPHIDIWSVGNEAVRALLNGINPYVKEYTQIYKDWPYECFYGYPPLPLIWYIPWSFLGDIRIGWVVAHLITGWLIYLACVRSGVSPRMRLLIPAAFVSFPILPFMIEQSFVDPLSLLLGVLMLLLFQSKQPILFAFVAGTFLVLKQSNVIATPFLVFVAWKMTARSERWKGILVALLPLILFVLPFYFWNPQAFHARVLWFLQSNALTANQPLELFIRTDHLSLMAFAARQGMPLPGYLSWVLALVSTTWILWSERHSPQVYLPRIFLGMAFTYFLFYSVSAWAFSNYYWFASLGIWMVLSHAPLRDLGFSLRTGEPSPV